MQKLQSLWSMQDLYSNPNFSLIVQLWFLTLICMTEIMILNKCYEFV
uniref:Uncharacterized protein n=1 Tax=Rhizophora mucronata TaxID=61149 RepID=A0A2P2QCL3_RHIMU